MFSTRLQQENWQTDTEISQKDRLEKMFAQTLEQVQQQNTTGEKHSEKSQVAGEIK